MLLVVISIALLTGLFEVYLWIRYEREYARLEARYENRELCTRAADDPRLVYEFVPDRCGFNSLGFDDTEFTQPKTRDTFRILLIGDSVAQGQGIDRTLRFGNLLAKQLNEAWGNVEIVNLARTGYSTNQELVLLETYRTRLEADLILWSYVLNDPAHPLFHDANGELGRYFYRPSWRGRHYVNRKLFEANESYMAGECGREFHRLLHCAYRETIASNLRRVGELAGDVPVVFAVHPVFDQVDSFEGYRWEGVHTDLASIADDADLIPVDLLHAYRGASPVSLAQRDGQDPWHPNALGHRLAADELATVIAPLVRRPSTAHPGEVIR